jgi:hypothetical protein
MLYASFLCDLEERTEFFQQVIAVPFAQRFPITVHLSTRLKYYWFITGNNLLILGL